MTSSMNGGASPRLLTPENSVLLLIDHQPQMAFATHSIVTDASGGVTVEAHETSIQRMVQAGVVPMTWLQVLLEWQRDWARQETYDAVLAVAREHGGAYGLGIGYAKAMLGEHASEAAKAA